VNVIATSAPHAGPRHWYEQLGRAYRSSLRAAPIFDTVGHNAYPETSSEAPSATHGKSIDEGDLGRLLAALRTAFAGTGQPLPGQRGVTVWYLEDGFQTIPSGDAYAGGVESDRAPVTEERQASQLAAALELAYCQPAVGAFFNFELRDDASLDGWQSGLLRPDWSAKPSFAAFAAAVGRAHAHAIACG
jgi:hypothetical protein